VTPDRKFKQTIQKEIYKTKEVKIAKVLSVNTNKTYNLELLDGTPIEYVRNQTNKKWIEEDYVHIEKAGGDWSIMGIAASRGGD